MALVSLKQLVDDAFQNGYAVGAFNVVNMEIVQGALQAAEENRSPLILAVAEAIWDYSISISMPPFS